MAFAIKIKTNIYHEGSRFGPLYYVVINHSQQENWMIRMLPVDVWQMMMPFFQEENKLIRMLPVDVWKLMMPFF